MKLRPVGDRALLCEVDDLATVHALRAAIIAARDDRVVDVVPGWRTVLVTFVGTVTDDAHHWLNTLSTQHAPTPVRKPQVIPVRYDGPDLDEVAAHTGLTREDVIARHVSATYTVAFLGFQPGFPYLAGLDPMLAMPRKATPRTSVPAGSIGIAGDVTGIYPKSSPGGWQLIGTTDVSLFDEDAASPALLAPGDTVRFAVA